MSATQPPEFIPRSKRGFSPTKVMNRSAKGARLEREVARQLAARGWSVVKGAASKSYGRGKIDLVAINPAKKVVFLLQVKNFKHDGLSRGEKERTELWQIFNPYFERKGYTVSCELVTSIKDVDLIEGTNFH